MALSWKKLTKQQRKDTEPWIRNKADEYAVDQGCWFDPVKACYPIWWIERHCRLYEGEGFAGQPVILNSIADQPTEWNQIPNVYKLFFDREGKPLADVMDFYSERMKWHNELIRCGEFMDWHFECHARIYGWQRVAAERWQKRGVFQVRRFRRARVWIAKKNKKSPSLAFNTLYLTFGDGEPGAKTFVLAKDGTQAVKTWDHARIMQEMSPELAAQTKVNLNLHRITHRSNHSYTEPLSSSNTRTKDAKHGINGNVVIDETHVVDRDLMDIVKDAGASRPQALELAFSTVGNNPESWGKEQWDLGERINSGEIKRDNFFHQSYHCPQDLTPKMARKDPEKYIKLANPALGHSVGMEELLPSFLESVNSPADWSNYAMLRLMVWQHSATGWLPPDGWASCGGHKFDDEELRQRPCVLGLDLAQKRDLAACVPVWRNEKDGVDISRPMFWCNQERIDDIARKFPGILEWVEAGLIRVNSGDVTDMRIIKHDIREFCLAHNVAGIVYDAKYAEWLIQQLTSGELDAAGNLMVDPLSIGEQSISQGIMTQTGPVIDFENGVRSRAIRHDDNPVLTWQFGNATVYTDRQGNRRIQKEDRHSFRTVDGCQACVMARWGAVDFTEWTTQVLDYYVKNEVEYV